MSGSRDLPTRAADSFWWVEQATAELTSWRKELRPDNGTIVFAHIAPMYRALSMYCVRTILFPTKKHATDIYCFSVLQTVVAVMLAFRPTKCSNFHLNADIYWSYVAALLLQVLPSPKLRKPTANAFRRRRAFVEETLYEPESKPISAWPG